jgi:hypothetical protein
MRLGTSLTKGRITLAFNLCLEGWTLLEGDDRPILSYDLDTVAEIDQAVQEIKADLDRAAQDAKAALRRKGLKLAR